MVNINLAYTGPVNPEGATPVLTVAQLWKGLERKVRHAPEFVPAIQDCKVIKEEGTTITREITFPPISIEAGKEGKTEQEVCDLYEPTKVDFRRGDGGLVENIISDDPTGGSNIYMTYAFHLVLPNHSDNPAEIEKTTKQQKNAAKNAVESTLKGIREMVADGRI